MHGRTETEAKWQASAPEHERMREALRRAKAIHLHTVHERNSLLDTADGALRSEGRVLRVRRLDNGRSVLTLKGPATYLDGIKTRDETELDLPDPDAMMAILDSLGFRVTVEYEKTRESWNCDGALVALDTLEFGEFVEIEGDVDQIHRMAALLALDLATVERRGYPSMMRAHRADERED